MTNAQAAANARKPYADAIKKIDAQKTALLSTLEFLADQWADEFDNDKPISGADFVEWFGECRRLHIIPAIAKSKS